MKSKKQILKMNRQQLIDYKWDMHLLEKFKPKEDNRGNVNCSNVPDCWYCKLCQNCFECTHCFNCSDCAFCIHLTDGQKHQFKICNMQFTKQEYLKKMRKLR